MLELYIIVFLVLFTNQKHKNMSFNIFCCSLSNHQVKELQEDPSWNQELDEIDCIFGMYMENWFE